MSERNLNYDLIRLLGLVVIMIAHSSPPDWLFQLRNFGTPLLVMGSGLTYALIYAKRNMDVMAFYRKRLSRLILPAWLFMAVLFVSFNTVSLINSQNLAFDLYTIVKSMSFIGGIDFIWIFKIYAMLALITPFAIWVNKRVTSHSVYFSALIAAYLFYEAMVYLISPQLYGVMDKIFNKVVFIFAAYSLVFLYAFRLSAIGRQQVAWVSGLSLLLFALIGGYFYWQQGEFVATQNYKFPPQLYYLAYAFFAINAIYLVATRLTINSSSPPAQAIIWLSSNSLWIYLWHIFAYYLWQFLLPNYVDDSSVFVVKTLYLFGFGIIATHLQNALVTRFPTERVGWKARLVPLLSGNR